MGKKVFISYKYSDINVQALEGNLNTTVRNYVDKLQDKFDALPHIYKAEEDDNDLSKFKNDTIASHLKDKIFDSTLTIVLVSPNMKDPKIPEDDQWIPWEISYSLKEHKRNNRASLTNALLAVILPDRTGSYNYYIQENVCTKCNCRILKTRFLFQIMSANMFNLKNPQFSICENHITNKPFLGESSYMYSVKWDLFFSNVDLYVKKAVAINEKIEIYKITKTIS
jgi:hypothetical protein